MKKSLIKYPYINKVVKAALCSSHGNCDVKHAFSTSANILTKDKAKMSEKLLNVRLRIIDALRNRYEIEVCNVPRVSLRLKKGQGAESKKRVVFDIFKGTFWISKGTFKFKSI